MIIEERNAHELYEDTDVINLPSSNGIVIRGQTIKYGSSNLLIDADFRFAAGKIYGIVARNGLGKSALLHRLNKARIGVSKMLVEQDQELENQDLPVFDAVINQNVELLRIKKRLAELKSNPALDDDDTLSEEYAELSNQIMEYGKDESEVFRILSGMGFTDDHLMMKVSQLSGGWRKRVVLAAAVYRRPDFLMLDEPTNHLDLEAVLWLENYLKKIYKSNSRRPKTLLVVSHNVEFMQSLTDTMVNENNEPIEQVIVTIEKSKLFYYNMSYLDFVEAREKRIDHGVSEGEYPDVKVLIENALKDKPIGMRDFKAADMNSDTFRVAYDIFRSSARIGETYTPQLHSQFMKIYNSSVPERLEFPLANPSVPRTISSANRRVLNVVDLCFSYTPDKPVLNMVNLRVNLGDVYCVCGRNGSGKSTFLKLVADEVEAAGPKTEGDISGLIAIPDDTRVGYYSQYSSEQIPGDMTALEYLHGINKKHDGMLRSSKDVYELLHFFGFPANAVAIPSKLLSGGQKSRVILAGLCVMQPHLIILDEPTNHLDIESIMALATTIRENLTNVAILIITHDPELINQLNETDDRSRKVKIVVMDNNRLHDYHGTINQYKQEILKGLGI